MPPLTIVHIVRHGETEENLKMIMQGQLDTELNATGREQAKLVASALRHEALNKAYSSDLSRARELIEDKALRERASGFGPTPHQQHLGSLQGKPVGTPHSANDPLFESHEQLAVRALAWWDQYIVAPAKSRQPGQVRVLVVSHGGFIGTLVKALVSNGRASVAPGVSVQKRALNVSITTVEVGKTDAGKIRGLITRYADTTHLDTAEAVGVVQANADELVRE
ncbi:histidine phosphatase superfamily [Schizophyllum fasciatum]